MNYYGLIPAKSRSRGMPGKNIAKLMGKPLVTWSIEAAINAPSIHAVFVSTESDQIGNISTQSGAKIIPRPLELCDDGTTSDVVISHAIPYMREFTEASDFGIVLLQPTSPLRTAQDIEQAINLFRTSNAQALVSVYPANSSLLKAYRIDVQEGLVGVFSPDAPYMPRQVLPKIYMPNGAIYIFTASKFQSSGGIPRAKVAPFIMEIGRSIDIDTQQDFELARIYLERHNAKMA